MGPWSSRAPRRSSFALERGASAQEAGPAASHSLVNCFSESSVPWAEPIRVNTGIDAPFGGRPVNHDTGSATPSITSARTRFGKRAA